MLTYKLIFFFIISLLGIKGQNSENTGNIKILDYYLDSKIYSIEKNEDNFKIITKAIIYCFKAPCIPPVIDIKAIEGEEECKSLQSLFEELFKDSQTNEIRISDGQLTEEQSNLILKVLYNNKILSKLEYEIINAPDNYNNKYSSRGYTYEIQDDKSIIYTISTGEKQSGGYSIKIQKVKIKGNSVSIYVSERVPGTDEIVTDAFTYPIAKIKFNEIPKRLKVINYDDPEDIYLCLTK